MVILQALAYGDLEEELQVTKRHGKKYTVVTAESFWRWALETREVSTDNKE